MDASQIVVSGYGIVPTASGLQRCTGLTPGLGAEVKPLSRRIKRFACRAGAQAITACQLAFEMADIDPEGLGENFGLYTNQSGYQNPDIDDYAPSLNNWDPNQSSALNHLWHSREVNPFLAINSLGNSLLGIVSVLWSLRGDCAAFVLNQAGAISALNEAVFNLRQGTIDSALVLSAGTDQDMFERYYQERYQSRHQERYQARLGGAAEDSNTSECGAVALLLQRKDVATKGIACISDVSQYYRAVELKSDVGSDIEPTDWQKIIASQSYYNAQEPRWGGIVYSLIQIIYRLQQQPNQTSIHIQSHDPHGLHASVRVKLVDGVSS